jgi:prepilin peptidase CpaA
MDVLAVALLLIFPLLIAVGGLFDVATLTIPNKVSLALVAGFAILAVVAGMSLGTAAIHVGFAAVALAAGIGLFAAGVVGGGDAKLLAAAILWLGLETPPFLLLMALYGGALAVVLAIYRRFPLPAVGERQAWLRRLHDRGSGVPYGLAIAGAALTVYPQTTWFTAFGG